MNESKCVLIMAGGTGGHVIPALDVAKAFIAKGYRVHWLGTRKGIESRLVPKAVSDILESIYTYHERDTEDFGEEEYDFYLENGFPKQEFHYTRIDASEDDLVEEFEAIFLFPEKAREETKKGYETHGFEDLIIDQKNKKLTVWWGDSANPEYPG